MKIKYWIMLTCLSLGLTFYTASFTEKLKKEIIVKNKYTEWTGKASNVCKYYVSDFNKEIEISRVLYNQTNFNEIIYYSENYNKYDGWLLILLFSNIILISTVLGLLIEIPKEKYKEIGGIPYNQFINTHF